jgi:hypothetical protein
MNNPFRSAAEITDVATATFVKKTREPGYPFGRAALYKVVPPVLDREGKETSYVWVSTSYMSGVETYAFPADESGEPIDMLELSGSEQGTADHEQVLCNMGYTLRYPM